MRRQGRWEEKAAALETMGADAAALKAALAEKVRVGVTTRTDSSMGVVDAGAVSRDVKIWCARRSPCFSSSGVGISSLKSSTAASRASMRYST
jgi:hypothetical protein